MFWSLQDFFWIVLAASAQRAIELQPRMVDLLDIHVFSAWIAGAVTSSLMVCVLSVYFNVSTVEAVQRAE